MKLSVVEPTDGIMLIAVSGMLNEHSNRSFLQVLASAARCTNSEERVPKSASSNKELAVIVRTYVWKNSGY